MHKGMRHLRICCDDKEPAQGQDIPRYKALFDIYGKATGQCTRALYGRDAVCGYVLCRRTHHFFHLPGTFLPGVVQPSSCADPSSFNLVFGAYTKENTKSSSALLSKYLTG